MSNEPSIPDLLMPDLERITLEKIVVAVGMHISAAQLSTFHVDVQEYVAGHLAVALRGHLYGKQEDVTETTRTVAKAEDFPVSWWDSLKGRLRERMPTLCRRMTVRTRQIETVVNVTTNTRTTRICPHLNVVSDYPHLCFLVGRPGYLSPEDLCQIELNQSRREREERGGRLRPTTGPPRGMSR